MKNFRIKITHLNTSLSIKENQPQLEIGPFDDDDDIARSFSYNDFLILKQRNNNKLARIECECDKNIEVYVYLHNI